MGGFLPFAPVYLCIFVPYLLLYFSSELVMETIRQTYQTPNGPVEGFVTKWPGFSILAITGPKGFLACPAIDIDACQSFGVAAAIVESSADNPIGTLERFCDRKITRLNQLAISLGLKEGMIAKDAFPLIA